MANKKFYYSNRNKNKPTQNQVNAVLQQVKTTYSEQQLNMSLTELGLSETTVSLLDNNKLNTACDLVRRTQKDMYKVQGLNKKIYLEISDALKKNNMAFREEIEISSNAENIKIQAEKQPKIAEKKPQSDKKLQSNQDNLNNSAKTQKNIVADNKKQKFEKRPQNENQKKFNIEEKVKTPKLTAPLPINQWKKIQKNGKWGFYDGIKTVIPAMYDEVFCFKEDFASVELDEKCGYIDSLNNVVISMEYETAFSFSEGVASVVRKGKCGYINKNNEIIIPFEYDAATSFENGEAKVKKDGKWGTIFKDGSIKWI